MTTANERLRNPTFRRTRRAICTPVQPPRAKPAASAAAFALSMLAASGAYAQTPSPLAEWQYSVGIPLEKMYQPNVPDWQIRLGMGATLAPRYDGSERYRPLLGPTVDIRYKDLFFLSTGEGVGVNIAQGRNWRVGIAGTYDLGRRGHDDPEHLNGLGNINPVPEVKLFGEYVVSDQFPLVLRGDVRRNIGGSNGWIGDLGAYMPLPGSNKQFFWFAGPSLTFADSKYMNSWFGVNQNQAVQSGYPQYGASAGLKSVGFGVSMVWFFQKHWFVTADGAVEQLVGSAQHSPIVQKATNAVVDLSFAYQF